MATRKPSTSERATALTLIGLFWSLVGATALLRRGNIRPTSNALDLVMLAFATFRMGRLIAFDTIAEPLRAPFTKTVPDETGAGDTVVAAGSGPRKNRRTLVLSHLRRHLDCDRLGLWLAVLPDAHAIINHDYERHRLCRSPERCHRSHVVGRSSTARRSRGSTARRGQTAYQKGDFRSSDLKICCASSSVRP